MTSDELERLRKLNELRKEDGLTEEEYNTLKAKIINQRTKSSYDKSTNPETPVDSSLSTKRAIDERINEIVESLEIIEKILLENPQLIKESKENKERIQKKMFDQPCDYTNPPIQEQAPDIPQELDYVPKPKRKEPIYGEPVKDIDGNVYRTVKIGNQLWMAENLKTTRYNDGTPIPHILDDEVWNNLTTGAYCWYDNIIENRDIYGALYNWFAVETGKLSPKGWRVPTDNDWNVLTDYLGGEDIAGGKLKEIGDLEAGNGLWEDPNEGATNETGFSALPGGYRLSDGSFSNVGRYGDWWSATERSGTAAWRRSMLSSNGNVNRNSYYKSRGFSVRCLRDL